MEERITCRRFFENDPKEYVDYKFRLEDVPILKQDLGNLDNIEEIQFLTSNENKVRELEHHLNLDHIKLSCTTGGFDIPEIQDSNLLTIVQDKCQRAFEHANSNNNNTTKPVVTLVEDTSLNFKALGGMPGPYVKWFLKAIGPMGLYKMLTGFEDKSAEAICIYALMPCKGIIVFFLGLARGQIVAPTVGALGWGWDGCFREQRSGLTLGQMDTETRSKFSHRASAVEALRSFLARP